MARKTYNQTLQPTVAKARWTRCDWGHYTVATDELTALRIAYVHRNSKHGVQVREAVAGFLVTLFDERCVMLEQAAAYLNELLAKYPNDLERVLLARHVVSKEYAEDALTVCSEKTPGVFTQSALGLLNTVLQADTSTKRLALVSEDGKLQRFEVASYEAAEK